MPYVVAAGAVRACGRLRMPTAQPQAQFAASSVLPLPLYTAFLGYGSAERDGAPQPPASGA